MPYAEGRIYNDADSHIMETKDWLFQYADPEIRLKLAPIDFTMCGGTATETLVTALPAILAKRRNDPAAMARAEANVLERKSWHALGESTPPSAARRSTCWVTTASWSSKVWPQPSSGATWAFRNFSTSKFCTAARGR